MGNLLPREESQRANTLSNTFNSVIPKPGDYLSLGLRGPLWATCSLGRRVTDKNTLSNTINSVITKHIDYLGLGLTRFLWATCSLGRRVQEQIHYPIPSTLEFPNLKTILV
jgi:hypothetical protein